jgi:hypothetical protein
MNKFVSAVAGLVTAWMLAVSITVIHAQQTDDEKPLGDVAREQRAIHKRQQNGLMKGLTTPPKTRSGPGMPFRSDANAAQQSVLDSTSVEERLIPAPTSQREATHSPQHACDEHPGSPLDGSKHSSPDAMILEASTEIKVDVDEQKVIVPVRSGFATAIPALSKVTVKSTRQFINAGDVGGNFQYTDYVDYATITGVTVEGVFYEVQTNSVPLLKGNASHEVTFTLASPVAISR